MSSVHENALTYLEYGLMKNVGFTLLIGKDIVYLAEFMKEVDTHGLTPVTLKSGYGYDQEGYYGNLSEKIWE
jgi:hypothetical protein